MRMRRVVCALLLFAGGLAYATTFTGSTGLHFTEGESVGVSGHHAACVSYAGMSGHHAGGPSVVGPSGLHEGLTEAPYPISAVWNGSEVIATFSEALVYVEWPDILSWRGRQNGYKYIATSVSIDGAVVTICPFWKAAEEGADVVTYFAWANDVVGAVSGLPAPAFADYPVASEE